MKKIRFNVTPAKEEELYQRMHALGIAEADLKEQFLLSGKNGGQNANKVHTKVRLEHIPTGLFITCNETRNQLLNRFLARRILVDKIHDFMHKAEKNKQNLDERYPLTKTDKKIAKIRRQKQKRKTRSKHKYT